MNLAAILRRDPPAERLVRRRGGRGDGGQTAGQVLAVHHVVSSALLVDTIWAAGDQVETPLVDRPGAAVVDRVPPGVENPNPVIKSLECLSRRPIPDFEEVRSSEQFCQLLLVSFCIVEPLGSRESSGQRKLFALTRHLEECNREIMQRLSELLARVGVSIRLPNCRDSTHHVVADGEVVSTPFFVDPIAPERN